MTIPIPECTQQELGVLETRLLARNGTGVGCELADAELEFERESGRLTAWPALALNFPIGEAS